MTCGRWLERLDAYVDGELPKAGFEEMGQHLSECASCSSHALARSQLKRGIHQAGKAFTPSAELRERIERTVRPRSSFRGWAWWPQLGFAVLALAFLVGGAMLWPRHSQPGALISELADLYVATLASPNPVDVASSDRHTVKPWFQGKVPFTFNLPELGGSPFELVGGRVTYLEQNPGAELLFSIRKHMLSLFIFKDSPELGRAIGSPGESRQELSFHVESWSEGGLRYIIISDAGPADIDDLRVRIQQASR